jgi:hypothetical protein
MVNTLSLLVFWRDGCWPFINGFAWGGRKLLSV